MIELYIVCYTGCCFVCKHVFYCAYFAQIDNSCLKLCKYTDHYMYKTSVNNDIEMPHSSIKKCYQRHVTCMSMKEPQLLE